MAEDNTPTNVVDDTPKQSNILDNITRELGGVDYVEFYTRKNNDKFPSVGVNVDANGNIIIFRATDDPNRLINSNFKQISGDGGTSGMGQQSYFATDFLYSKEYSYRENNKIYGFNTNIKPEEILQLNKTLNDYPDLAKALQPQSIFTKPKYKNTLIHYLISQQMNIPPEIWNKNISIIKSLGYKAIGTPITGQPHNYGVNYEIVPLIDDNKNVEIKPIGEIKYRGVNPETDKMLNAYDRESYEVEKLDTPTNVVDDINLTGTTGGNTNVKGNNIAYVDVEELYPYVQYDRRTDTRGMPDDYIDIMKETIYEKGFMYDDANEGVNVFAVFFDDTGNVQINEGNHRLRALFEVAQETGQKIYVPVNPFITKIKGGNKVQNVSTTDAYNAIEQLIRDLTEADKNFNTEYAIETKLGEPGRGVSGLETYTYPGGPGGTSATQNDIKKFFQSIGINAITYDELPDDSIYKTGVNTFIDTPGGSLSGGSLGAAKLNDPLVFDSWVDNLGRTTTSFVDNLPLETVVKNRVKNLITTKTKQLAKPGSLVVKAVDAWEFGVIGLMAAGIALNEIDEVPTIITNTAINMFNSMTAPYGIAPVKKEEYDIDYEFINTVLDTGSKVMPTDIIIEKLKPYSLEEGEDVILPGTGVTATTGAKQQFEPYGEELAKRAEKTVNMKRDEVKQDLLESKGVQEEKMFEQAKPKKSKPTGGAGAKIL